MTSGDNLTQSEEDDLETIQLEAARIICGATKLVSINNLYSETGLEPLSIRRRTHNLILFYKMYHALAFQPHSKPSRKYHLIKPPKLIKPTKQFV